MKKQIIAHIAAGLPFIYHKHNFTRSNYILQATKDESEADGYFIHDTHYIYTDVKICKRVFTDCIILENLQTKPEIFFSAGPFNSRQKFNLKNVQLLNSDFTPLTK